MFCHVEHYNVVDYILSELKLVNIWIVDFFFHRINKLHTAISIKSSANLRYHFFLLRCMLCGFINLLRLSTPLFVFVFVLCFVDIVDTIFTDLVLYTSFHLQIISPLQNFTSGDSPTPFVGFHDQKSAGKSFFSAKFHMHQFYFQITLIEKKKKKKKILAMYRDYPRLNYIRHCKILQRDSKQSLRDLSSLQRVLVM